MRTHQQRLRQAVGCRKRRLQGYTLIEVIVALLFIGIVAAIAAPSWLSFRQRQQIRSAADRLQSALQEAKSSSRKNSVRYGVTVCSISPDSTTANTIEYSVHPYAEPPYRFTTIEKVSLVKSTVRRSPARYNLPSLDQGDCYTTYLGLFPGEGYALGFFYLSSSQQTYIYRAGFNTLIGNVVSCPVLSLEKLQCR
jgi:prepilin-type N-terminal cleavage/methylation domain-containing protein